MDVSAEITNRKIEKAKKGVDRAQMVKSEEYYCSAIHLYDFLHMS